MKKLFTLCFAILVHTFVFGQVTQSAKKINPTTNAPSRNATNPDCFESLSSKKGNVFSLIPGLITTKSKHDEVIVSIKKTGGKARTQVNIYVNGHLTKKTKFDNGSYKTKFRTKTLKGVKNKRIKVEIINQSVGNTFSYHLKIEGKKSKLLLNNRNGITILNRNKKHTVYIKESCTKHTQVIFERLSGDAKVKILIYEKGRNDFSRSPKKVVVIEANENNKSFIIHSWEELKMQIQNLSSNVSTRYKLTAVAY